MGRDRNRDPERPVEPEEARQHGNDPDAVRGDVGDRETAGEAGESRSNDARDGQTDAAPRRGSEGRAERDETWRTRTDQASSDRSRPQQPGPGA